MNENKYTLLVYYKYILSNRGNFALLHQRTAQVFCYSSTSEALTV